jgi:hypothetical protein
MRALISAALAALTIVVFAPVRHAGFIQLDDPVYVAQNPHGSTTRTGIR